jgi:arginyl-tRNA synthetase
VEPAERPALARMIGIAAVKFADLSGDRLSGYVFDAERLVAFEGKTGPYLQYAVVRLRSLLEKAAGMPVAGPHATLPAERELVLACLAFGSKVAEAGHLLQPGVLAAWAHDIAQRFSKFYDRCEVLREGDETLRASRLGICRLTLAVLERALGLLGIDVPARM